MSLLKPSNGHARAYQPPQVYPPQQGFEEDVMRPPRGAGAGVPLSHLAESGDIAAVMARLRSGGLGDPAEALGTIGNYMGGHIGAYAAYPTLGQGGNVFQSQHGGTAESFGMPGPVMLPGDPMANPQQAFYQPQPGNVFPVAQGYPVAPATMYQVDGDYVILGLDPVAPGTNAIAAAGTVTFSGTPNRNVRIKTVIAGSDNYPFLLCQRMDIGDARVITGAQNFGVSVFRPDVMCCPLSNLFLAANVPFQMVVNNQAGTPTQLTLTVICEPRGGPSGGNAIPCA